MVYSDTDFWLALIKDQDWLSQNAKNYYERYEDELEVSIVTFVELFFIEQDFDFDRTRAVNDIFEMADMKQRSIENVVFQASEYIDEGANSLDAFHASFAEDRIISSDSIYDELGLERIPLEEDPR